MKIALFNDTRPVQHFGCDAVMSTIESQLARRGHAIVFRHRVGRDWSTDRSALKAIDDADRIIVNGEGSIHHDKARAVELAGLGPYCSERGKPCFLLNSTIQGNGPALMENVGRFTAVWVRERASQNELSRFAIEATVCPDLSFGQELPAHAPKRDDTTVVIDSTLPETRVNLGKAARAAGFPYVSMRHNGRGLRVYGRSLFQRLTPMKPRGTISAIMTFQEYAAFIASFGSVVSGRFHGLCFAINSRIPFTATVSDTWKCEALIADVGLNPARMVTAPGPRLPFSDGECEAIDLYVAAARVQIDRAFEQILN